MLISELYAYHSLRFLCLIFLILQEVYTHLPCFAGNIDCRELVIGLSAILEGEDSFARFVFDMYDETGSGVLQPNEVENFTRVSHVGDD